MSYRLFFKINVWGDIYEELWRRSQEWHLVFNYMYLLVLLIFIFFHIHIIIHICLTNKLSIDGAPVANLI